jgi:hypothetical protein
MQQAQFFAAGVLIIWLIGTGKLAALMDALRTDPNTGAKSVGSTDPNTGNNVPGSGGNPQISPGVG